MADLDRGAGTASRTANSGLDEPRLDTHDAAVTRPSEDPHVDRSIADPEDSRVGQSTLQESLEPPEALGHLRITPVVPVAPPSERFEELAQRLLVDVSRRLATDKGAYSLRNESYARRNHESNWRNCCVRLARHDESLAGSSNRLEQWIRTSHVRRYPRRSLSHHNRVDARTAESRRASTPGRTSDSTGKSYAAGLGAARCHFESGFHAGTSAAFATRNATTRPMDAVVRAPPQFQSSRTTSVTW